VHNTYTWCIGTFFPNCTNSSNPPDGTAFTDFLPRVNGTLCDTDACTGLAGYSDWRLPTISELQTIVDMSAPGCFDGLCIDPTFGPTQSGYHWSCTTDQTYPDFAWNMSSDGLVWSTVKNQSYYVRAVRSGS
jgi:hypothetical protein